jgi:HTH-type transcriptional regulator/antitoxin HigA
VLLSLIEQHQLKQADLPELGSQGVVSELLSGKRKLNLRQVRALAGRFGVPVNAFLTVEHRH